MLSSESPGICHSGFDQSSERTAADLSSDFVGLSEDKLTAEAQAKKSERSVKEDKEKYVAFPTLCECTVVVVQGPYKQAKNDTSHDAPTYCMC